MSIQTTFLPEYNIKDTKNDFQEADFINPKDFEKLDNSLGIRSLSIFSELSREEIKSNLHQFVNLYGDWIDTQKDEQKQQLLALKNDFSNSLHWFFRMPELTVIL